MDWKFFLTKEAKHYLKFDTIVINKQQGSGFKSYVIAEEYEGDTQCI